MSTVMPRRAETFEESSSRRELFCLVGRLVKGFRGVDGGREGKTEVPFALVGV